MRKLNLIVILFSGITLLSGCAEQMRPKPRPIQVKEDYSSLLNNQSQSFKVNKTINLQSFPQVKQAAREGDPDAQYALGYMYFYGKNGARQDVALGQQWIEQAASSGQPQALQAIKLFKEAAHPDAGNVYMENENKTSTKAKTIVVSSKKPKTKKQKVPKATPKSSSSTSSKKSTSATATVSTSTKPSTVSSST